MPTVRDIADHLAPELDRARYHQEGDPAGVWLASDREVRRLGLRLEPGRAPYDWAEGIDAVLMHRPFGLWPARLPDGLGVLAVHRALDDRFSVGYNPDLAAVLGLEAIEPLWRDAHRIGLTGDLRQPVGYDELVGRIVRTFGGVADVRGPEPERVEAVALVGAMTAPLVKEAAARGATLYLTGQLRPVAFDAVRAAELRVIAVGQDRAEAWGLRHLGGVVRARWPDVVCVASDLPGDG